MPIPTDSLHRLLADTAETRVRLIRETPLSPEKDRDDAVRTLAEIAAQLRAA